MYNPVILVTLWNILCISEVCHSALFGCHLISWFFMQNYTHTHTRARVWSISVESFYSSQIVGHLLVDCIIIHRITKIRYKKMLSTAMTLNSLTTNDGHAEMHHLEELFFSISKCKPKTCQVYIMETDKLVSLKNTKTFWGS